MLSYLRHSEYGFMLWVHFASHVVFLSACIVKTSCAKSPHTHSDKMWGAAAACCAEVLACLLAGSAGFVKGTSARLATSPTSLAGQVHPA